MYCLLYQHQCSTTWLNCKIELYWVGIHCILYRTWHCIHMWQMYIVSLQCAHCISIGLYQYAATHSTTYTRMTASILSAPFHASCPAPAPALFLLTFNVLSPLYVNTIDSALSVEAARTSKSAASAGGVKVAAYASTSDSATSRWLYACIRRATLQSVSLMGIGVVMFHIMGWICQIIVDRGEDFQRTWG
jgi:hypothetical protein